VADVVYKIALKSRIAQQLLYEIVQIRIWTLFLKVDLAHAGYACDAATGRRLPMPFRSDVS
jgi:hypothetical protein